MTLKQADIAVIGGGPAGYVAAITAAQRKRKVILVESGELGGTCLNVGCIPTKTLAQVAELYHRARNFSAFGLEGSLPKINWSQVQARKETVVSALRRGVAGLLKANRVEVIRGHAAFSNRDRLTVTPEPKAGKETINLAARKTIIATGSQAASIPGLTIDEETVLTSTGALELKKLPESLAVIGGGVIGLEMASIFSLLGCRVTVIELLPQVLAGIDEEIAKLLAGELKKQGIAIHTGARVEEVKVEANGEARVSFLHQGQLRQVRANKVLVAVGRLPQTAGLDLGKAGITLSGKAIQVNRRMETNIAGIYAAGDVIGGYQLAHVAFHEGTVAAINASTEQGGDKEVDYRSVPACVYTQPEVAQVGLSETEARQQYAEARVGKFPLAANGKSLIEGQTAGLVKVIYEPRYGEILGVCIMGPHATELIAEAALAISQEITLDELVDTIHAHPTVAEAIREAGLAALGNPLHTVP